MSKQVTNEEVLATGKKKRQAQRQKTAAETNKFNATKVAGHEAAAEQALAEADAINQEVEEGIVAENNVETPTYQSITYNGKTYSPEEVGKMFNAIETWGQHNLRPGDLKRFQKGMEGLHAQNQAGHIFISGVDPDYNRRGKFGGDANIIPERLLLKLLEGSSGGTQTTSTTSSTGSANLPTTGTEVGSMDAFRKYIMESQFGGNYQQYKADLEAEERYTTREERLEHIRDAARAIMTERNKDTQYIDQLGEKDLLKQMQALGVNMNEVRQYLGIQKEVVDPYNITLDMDKIPGYTKVADYMNDGYAVIEKDGVKRIIDSNYQPVEAIPDHLFMNKNGKVLFTDSQGNILTGDLTSFDVNQYKALQNANNQGRTPFQMNPYKIGDDNTWNDYFETLFAGQTGEKQWTDLTGKFPELTGYGDYKIIATDGITTDGKGLFFNNSNAWLFNPKTGQKEAIKINTGSDSKITITGANGQVLYNGFGEDRQNYDLGWYNAGIHDLSYMNDYEISGDVVGNANYDIDLEEINLKTGDLKDNWWNNDIWRWINPLPLGPLGALLSPKYGKQLTAEQAEQLAPKISNISRQLLSKTEYDDVDTKAYAYTVYRILTKEGTQSLQKGVREFLKDWSPTHIQQLHNKLKAFGIIVSKTPQTTQTESQKQGGVLKAQSGMSLNNMVTPENADIYKAQWAEQKAIDDYNNMEMMGDPHVKTKGGHGIGSNEWDIYDTADSIVIGLDTLAAGASFIPGVGSIVSAISGVAATGVQLINDIAKGEEGSTVLKNLAWNGAFAVLGAIPGVKALKAGKAIKQGIKAVDKSVDAMKTAAKAGNMDDALNLYETAADSIKSTFRKDKKVIGLGLDKLANNEWVMGAAKYAGRAMQVAGAGTGAIGAYNVITDAASGEEVQLQDVRMMLGGLTGTAAGAMHSLGKRAAKNVGTTVGDTMDELGIISKQAASGKQKVKLGKHEIEIDVPANMTKGEAREAAKSQLIAKRDEAKRVAALKAGTKDGDVDVTEALIKQKQSEADELDKLLAKDEKFFSRKLKLSGFDEKAAKQPDDQKEQLIATKPKIGENTAWENFGRWYGKRYLGLDEASVKQMFKADDTIDDIKAYQKSKTAKSIDAETTKTSNEPKQVEEPTSTQKPAVNPTSDPNYNPKNASMEDAPQAVESPIKTPIEVQAQTRQQLESPIKGVNESPKISNTKKELSEYIKNNPGKGLKLRGGKIVLERDANGKLTREAKAFISQLSKQGIKRRPLKPGEFRGLPANQFSQAVYELPDGTLIYYQQGGSLNQIQLQKLGGLAQKANNRLGESSNIQVDKFQPGGSARPAGSSANIQYTSENPNWFSLMGNEFIQQLINKLKSETDPEKRKQLVNRINEMQRNHAALYKTQTTDGKLKDWITKDEATSAYQKTINDEFSFVNTDGISNATNQGLFTTTKNSYGIDSPTKWGTDGLYGAQTDMRRLLGRSGDYDLDPSMLNTINSGFGELGYEMYLDEPTGYYMLKEKSATDPTVKKPEDNTKVNHEVEPKKDPNVTIHPTPEGVEPPKQYMGLDATAVEALPTLLRSLQTNKANLELMNSTNAPLHRYKNDHYKLTTDLTSENYLGALAAQAYHHADNVAHNTADLRQAQAIQMQGNQQASDLQLQGAQANKKAYDESSKIAIATENEDSNYNRQVADTNDQIINADIMAKMQQLARYNIANKNNWDTYETTVRMGKDLVKKQLASQAQQKAYMDYQNNYKTAYDKYTTDTNAVTDAISSQLQTQKDTYDKAVAGGKTDFGEGFDNTFDWDSKVGFYTWVPGKDGQVGRYVVDNSSLNDPIYGQAYQKAIQEKWTWNQLKEYLNNQAYKTYESSIANYYRDYNNTLNGTQYVHGQYYHIPYQEPWRGHLSDRTITQHKEGGTLSAKDRKEIVRLREGYKNLQKQVENMYESLKRDSKMVENILDGLSKERSFLLKQIFR